MNFSLITTTIPVPNGELASDAAVKVVLSHGTAQVKTINTTLDKYTPWITELAKGNEGGGVKPALSSMKWLDFINTPMGMVIGHGGEYTVALLLKTWNEKDQFVDYHGGVKSSYVLPPTLVGGAWNVTTKKLVWSGVAFLPAIMPFNLQASVHPWPLGNVYGQGHICWGQVGTTDLTSVADIFNLATKFFTSGFNSDLRVFNPQIHVVNGKLDTNKFPAMPIANWVKLGGS